MANFDRDDTFLARWLNGELTDAERADFEQSDDYEAYAAIAENAQDLSAKAYDKEAAWDELDKLTTGKSTAKVRKFKPWRAAAAAALILLSAMAWYLTGNQTISTLAGQQELIALPDGSTALLNGQSTLQYNSRLWSWGRTLSLTGEGFFEVEKGEEFTVQTELGEVEVLGTSFNVYSRKTDFEVHCLTGRVSVGGQDGVEEVVLAPGEAITYRSGEGNLIAFDSSSGPAWQSGENRYKSASIMRVIRDLEAQFGLVFDVDFIDRDQQFSGVFIHADVDQALDMVFAPMGISYTRNGDRVRLSVE
ncbi:MAG: FecR domain-containing protein [Bacteroidota bacterium]